MANRHLHGYAANFGDDLAKRLINRLPKKGIVLDPFVGSGTTVIEALELGHEAIGIDVDPIACLITKATARNYTQKWLENFQKNVLSDLDKIERALALAKVDGRKLKNDTSFLLGKRKIAIPAFDAIDYWFTSNQKKVLACLVSYMNTLPAGKSRELFAVTISSSIVRKWPNTISLAMDIDHSRPHKTVKEHDTVKSNFDIFRYVFMKNIKTLKKRQANFAKKAVVLEGDNVLLMKKMTASSLDMVLSSPPYINAIDYPRAHKFSSWWLFEDEEKHRRKNYIGLKSGSKQIDSLQIKANPFLGPSLSKAKWFRELPGPQSRVIFQYIADMVDVINECSRLLKKRGILVFVIADNRIKKETLPIVSITAKILRVAGMKDVRIVRRKISTKRRRYPFAIGNVMTEEAIIYAQK